METLTSGVFVLHLFGKVPLALRKRTGRGCRGWSGAVTPEHCPSGSGTAGRRERKGGLAGQWPSGARRFGVSWSSRHGVLEMHVRSFKGLFLETFSRTRIDELRAFRSMLEWHPVCRMESSSQLPEIHRMKPARRFPPLHEREARWALYGNGRRFPGLLLYSKGVSENTRADSIERGQLRPGLISGRARIHLTTDSLFLQRLGLKTDRDDFSQPCGVIPITFTR